MHPRTAFPLLAIILTTAGLVPAVAQEVVPDRRAVLASPKKPPADASTRENDSRQLRLEADAGLIQITTMHKAKGLEYAVVVLPFVARSSEPPPSSLRVHDFHLEAAGPARAWVAKALPASSDIDAKKLADDEDDEAASRLHQLGVRHLLRDPVRPSVLFDALTSVLAVSVPSLTADKQKPTADREPPSPPFSGHILVAEDNRINQMFIIELLKHFGCTCDIANNGDEVLTALQLSQYDLILMDCQMPEMDGFTAAREIRRREAADGESHHIPIIALTANALKGDRERCLESGMDDYLSKPLQGIQLQTLLEKYLGQANRRKPASDGNE